MHSVFPRNTPFFNITRTPTTTPILLPWSTSPPWTITTENPVYSTFIQSWFTAGPSEPSALIAWETSVLKSQVCTPPATLLPNSLKPIYDGYESKLDGWVSNLAVELGSIHSDDPQYANEIYSDWMWLICTPLQTLFSSVYHDAVASVTATEVVFRSVIASSSAAASAGEASALTGAVLAGVLGVVALL